VCTRYTNTDSGKHVTYASGREWNGVSLLVFHVPDAILRKIDATWDKEEIYLAVCNNRVRKDRQVTPELRRRVGTWGFVNVAWLKGNLCGEGDGTSKHLNRDFMGEGCVWW
jgi:hypothetical protein